MKTIRPHFFLLVSFSFLLAGCNDSKQTKTESKEGQSATDQKPGNDVPAATGSGLTAPDFADPEVKQYYAAYTAYLNKVIASIQNKDEAGTIKLFSEEGKLFNDNNEMEKKARENEEQKFTAWIMQALPYQKIIVESEYYKKFNEDYYKKVKEDSEKKN